MVIDLIVVFGFFVSKSETVSQLCNDDVRTCLVSTFQNKFLQKNLPPWKRSSLRINLAAFRSLFFHSLLQRFYVVNLMRTNAFVDHTDEINSPYALVPIIVYCFDRSATHLTDAEIRKMVKWFYYSQLRTRYISQL